MQKYSFSDFTYDNFGNRTVKQYCIGGNISTVSQYSYTTEERPVSGITRTYSYTNDRLKSITEYSEYSTITYDSAGNPLQWRGNVLQWNGRKNLLSMKNNDNSVNIECTYDSSGIRQSKKTSGKTTTYYTEGSIIHKETRSDGTKLWYYYDQTGIAAIEYNGKMYYLEKNIQGDIVAIIDSNQKVAAKYVYDAWGSHKVYNGNGQQIYDSISGSISEAGSIGNVNPFRYRGYYYDEESGLHWIDGYGYKLPHTHIFEWYKHGDIWRFIETIWPF